MIRNKFFHLAALLRNERRPLPEIRKLQDRKLRLLVRHAYQNVSLYREKFDEAGVRPDSIRSVADISRLPIIDKKDFHCRTREKVLDRRLTSAADLVPLQTTGSSGIILEFWADRQYDTFRKAQFMRPYVSTGRGLRDRLLWLRARPVPEKTWFRKLGFLREYQAYAGADVQEQIAKIREIRPHILMGYPSVIARIAARIKGRDLRGIRMKAIYSDSEILTPPMRERIERAFGVKAIDVYGTFETENIAYECARHEGYHIAADCVIMEFLKAGRPVSPGEEGEVVCTVLDNYATPFIRYNLHDLASYSDRPCSCGRTFPLMTKITGRSHIYALKANGGKISATTLSGNFWPLSHDLLEFQIIQEGIDEFRVRVVPSRYFDASTEGKIRNVFQTDFPHAKVAIECVEMIEKRDQSKKFLEFKSMLNPALQEEE